MAFIHPSDGDGPAVKVVGTPQPPPTRADRIQVEADELLRKADLATDPYLRQGYRNRAAALLDPSTNTTDRSN